jgi:hypothetical protein
MQHIARWLIHSGVGYTDFVAALKPIFYEQAMAELERIQQNKTDSAVSLSQDYIEKMSAHLDNKQNNSLLMFNLLLQLVFLPVLLQDGLL